MTSTIVNVGLKPLGRRRRPDRVAHDVLEARHVPMPESTSFPSGHSASAFAFAAGVAHVAPGAGRVARIAAAIVAYSRIHTGVHYPGDVLAGSLTGVVLGKAHGGGTASGVWETEAMSLIDISVPIRARMPIWDRNPGVHTEFVQSIAAGDHANVTRIDFGAHTGHARRRAAALPRRWRGRRDDRPRRPDR